MELIDWRGLRGLDSLNWLDWTDWLNWIWIELNWFELNWINWISYWLIIDGLLYVMVTVYCAGTFGDNLLPGSLCCCSQGIWTSTWFQIRTSQSWNTPSISKQSVQKHDATCLLVTTWALLTLDFSRLWCSWMLCTWFCSWICCWKPPGAFSGGSGNLSQILSPYLTTSCIAW